MMIYSRPVRVDSEVLEPEAPRPTLAGPQARIRNRWPHALRRLAPWLLLAGFLWWGWRGQDFMRSVPAYGDILEFTWALTHYSTALAQHTNPLLAPNAFFPTGWDLTTYGQGFVFLPLLLPLYQAGGAAFAYNAVVFASFVLAFAGAYLLARRWLKELPSAVFAVLVAFWGLRWFQTIGHINILWGTALMPWIAWCIERGVRGVRAYAVRGENGVQGPQRRALVWFVLAGAAWAASTAGSLYFIWINGLLVAGWLFGRRLARDVSWRQSAIAFGLSAGTALLVTSPIIIATWRASQSAGAQFYPLSELSFWSASLNSLPAPTISHPWLSRVAGAIFQGMPYESGAANFGLAASIAALVGAVVARRHKAWWPATVVAAFGLILALGVVLKWNDTPVRASALAPLNRVLWQAGHTLKPDVFAATPAPTFEEAIPLPGFLLTLVVPFFERARVFARYGFVASIGVYLLAALALARARPAALRWLFAAVLVFEALPATLSSLPYPPPAHPAFEWLSQQPSAGEGVLDLVAAHPYTVVPVNRGESVWASLYHRWPTVAGASSVWPAPAAFLHDWLAVRPHGLAERQTVPLLRFYRARYLLLHMTGEWEQQIREEAAQNPELRFTKCFPSGATGASPWPEEICAFEVLPSATPGVNLVLEDGWSKPEAWGVWAEGPESNALWVATERGAQTLTIEVFPNCTPDRMQGLTVVVNGQQVAEHQWSNCDPWAASVPLPETFVQPGRNEVVFRPAYAQAPAGDTRALSVGFSKLSIK